jgi:hypothetical protein
MEKSKNGNLHWKEEDKNISLKPNELKISCS